MVVDHRNVGAAFRRLSHSRRRADARAISCLASSTRSPSAASASSRLAGATAASTLFFTARLRLASDFCSGISIIGAQRIGARRRRRLRPHASRRARSCRLRSPSRDCVPPASSARGLPCTRIVGDLASAARRARRISCCAARACFRWRSPGTLIVGLGAAGNRSSACYVIAIVNLVHIPLLLDARLGLVDAPSVRHRRRRRFVAALRDHRGRVYALVYVASGRLPRSSRAGSGTGALALRVRAAWACPKPSFCSASCCPTSSSSRCSRRSARRRRSVSRAQRRFGPHVRRAESAAERRADVIGQRLGARDVPGARGSSSAPGAFRCGDDDRGDRHRACAPGRSPTSSRSTPQVAAMAALPLALHMITLPLKGWAMVSLAPIRASGDTRFSMTMGIVCSALVIPVAWLGIERLHFGLYRGAVGWIVAWTARAALTRDEVARRRLDARPGSARRGPLRG